MGGPLMAEARVRGVRMLSKASVLLSLSRPPGFPGQGIAPGQFAKLRVLSLGPGDPPGTGDPPGAPGPSGGPGSPSPPPPGRALLDKPFSFHGADGDNISFLIRAVGPETRLFPRLSPGALVRVTGPLGRIRPEIANPDPERPLILVAGGAGLGPMGMFKALRATAAPKAPGAPKAAGAPKGPDSPGGPPLTLIYGERTGAAQIDRGYLGGLADRVIPFTDDGTGYGEKGLASQGLRRLLDEKGPPPRVFACGPQGLLRELSGIASAKGAELYVSAEAFMACGLGVCLSCSSEAGPGGRVLLCRDGPVFAAPELRL